MSEDHDLTRRIHEKAYKLWIEEGRPAGKDKEHWEKAKVEITNVPKEPTVDPLPAP